MKTAFINHILLAALLLVTGILLSGPLAASGARYHAPPFWVPRPSRAVCRYGERGRSVLMLDALGGARRYTGLNHG